MVLLEEKQAGEQGYERADIRRTVEEIIYAYLMTSL